MYKAQRQQEIAEREAVEAEEARKRNIIEEEKARLLAEHADVLNGYHPKAATQYGASGFQH